MMGEYDPERARTEIAYHDAWVSCERLVNMRRSGENAAAGNNFIPANRLNIDNRLKSAIMQYLGAS